MPLAGTISWTSRAMPENATLLVHGAERASWRRTAVDLSPTLQAMPLVRIDGSRLSDWESFHDVFAAAFGFPSFYGRNMDAWIDCMTSLDAPDDGLTSVHGNPTDPVVLHVEHGSSIPREIFDAISECSAFVNWRRLAVGEPAILVLSCWRTEPVTQ
jgi:RNAse (barnase) inhibitor barstar